MIPAFPRVRKVEIVGNFAPIPIPMPFNSLQKLLVLFLSPLPGISLQLLLWIPACLSQKLNEVLIAIIIIFHFL
jgi:hypothetical protein